MSRLGSSGHAWWRRHETLPFVAQMEFAECGAACLCAVLRRYGHHASLLDVRLACDVSRDGTSAWDLAQAARGYGLKVDALRATYAGIRKRAAGPLILHWQGNHFVAVERFTRRGAILMDPASGRRAAGHAELTRSFTGIALMLRPEPAFVRKKRASTLARPIALMRQAGGDMAFIALTLFFLEVIGLLFPALTQVLIDGIVLPRQEDWLWILGAVGASAALLELGLRVLRDDASRRLGATLDVELKHRFVQRLMALPVLFFRQRAPGDLLQRAAGTAALRSLTTSLVQVSLDACLVLGYAALMLAYHPGLAALTIALNVLQVALMVLITLPTGRLIATELVHSGKESATLMEALHSPEAVHAFGAQSFFRERYHDRLVARLSSGVAWRRYTHGSGALNVLLDAVTLVLVLWVGGNHVIAGEMTPGALAAFLALQAMLVQPMGALVAFLYELRGVRGVLERIEDIEDAPPEASGSEAPLALRGELRFRGVAFGYRRNTAPLFQNVDFEVRPGEHIAIVGASGAGKSTLLSLLLGLSTPSEGSIEIDGRDLRTIALAPFRRAVGVVLQDPFFIDDTVRANLCLSDPELPLERVVAAARLACIDSVIEALPRGYDTPIGEAGQRLSGGERQRLALARALVSHPRILIMDEATSAMDAETERRVQANLGQLEITRLTIAHRLGTVRNAHRIVVLANGGVAQEGRYEQLAQVPGLFRDMLEAGS